MERHEAHQGDDEALAIEVPDLKHRKKQKLAEVVCGACNRTWPFSACINVGSDAYPYWRDRPCHSASKALERAAESRGPSAKEAHHTFKKLKPRQWRRDVLKFRVCLPTGPPLPEEFEGIDGVASSSERKSVMSSYIESQVVLIARRATSVTCA